MAATACRGEVGTRPGPARGDSRALERAALRAPITGTSGPIARIIREAMGTLMSRNRSELLVARTCGMGGGPPPGHWAVEYLIAARRRDLLECAFRSAPTPEGRIWAASGLVEAGVLTLREARDFTRGLEGPVWVCNGCIILQRPAADAAEALFRSV